MKVLLLALLVPFLACTAARVFAADQPNILFLFADDLAYDAVGFMGNKEVRTPTLDKLSASGTTFETAYNSGAWHGAVCIASRTMLITGSQLWTAKKNEKKQKQIYADTQSTWPQRMKALGYETLFTGKWHVQTGPELLHDKVIDQLPGMPGTNVENQYRRPDADGKDHWDATKDDGSGYWKGGKHWTVRTADHAIELLEGTAKSHQPFFLSVAFNAPHDPRQTPARVLDTYRTDEILVPENFVPEYPIAPEKIGLGKNWSLRDEKLAPVPRTEIMVKTHRREYYSAITYLDENVARVLEALEISGKAENTIIIFTADHGLACGEHGLMGKQNMHEHSLRVPFFITGPGIPANQRRAQMLYLQDAVPSSLVLAGAGQNALKGIDFQSIIPAIKDPKTPSREVLCASYQNSQRAIRDRDWKLILYPNGKMIRVYNLAMDPTEIHDLAESEEGIKQAKRLFALLLAEQKKLGDPLDLRPTFPQLSQKQSL